MRLFLPIFLLITSNVSFAQDSATIKEINELVGPKFHFDIANNGYGDDFFIIDKSNNNLIVSVWDTGIDNRNPLKKIFVLRMVGKKLTIIDTSSTFEVDGRGPDVHIHTDTIIIDHGCHGCSDWNTYKFNKEKQKYLLVSLKYVQLIKSSNPLYNNLAIGVRKEYYNVNKQELTIKVWNDDETKIKSKKIIEKPLPKDFIPDLAHYIDLVGEDLRNIHLQ